MSVVLGSRFCLCLQLHINIGEVLDHRAWSSSVELLFGSVLTELLQNGSLAGGSCFATGAAVLVPACLTSEKHTDHSW